jgi:hypothetical protein
LFPQYVVLQKAHFLFTPWGARLCLILEKQKCWWPETLLECYALYWADFDCFSLRQQVLPMRSNGGKSGVHGLLRGWIEQDIQLYVFMSCADWFEMIS